MFKRVLISGMILLSMYMIYQEILIMGILISNKENVSSLLLGNTLSLIYIIPLIIVSLYFLKKEKLSKWPFGLAIFAGAFMIGRISGNLNFELTKLLGMVIPKDIMTKWVSSIAPPFVEELLKLIVALLVVYVSGFKTLRSWMVIGLGSGLGFQFSEDYTYIVGNLVDKEQSVMAQALSRIAFSFATHWLLTALFMGGCFIVYHQLHMRKNVLTYLYLFSPWVLHVLWNTTLVDSNGILKLFMSLVSWALLINLYRYSVANNQPTLNSLNQDVVEL